MVIVVFDHEGKPIQSEDLTFCWVDNVYDEYLHQLIDLVFPFDCEISSTREHGNCAIVKASLKGVAIGEISSLATTLLERYRSTLPTNEDYEWLFSPQAELFHLGFYEKRKYEVLSHTGRWRPGAARIGVSLGVTVSVYEEAGYIRCWIEQR